MEETYSFRPAFGQVLTVAIAIIAVVSLVLSVSGIGDFIRYMGPALLVPAVMWALFWRPSVDVNDAGVTMRNVTNTIELPWAAIEWVDTKYALTLGVGDDKYAAWAAPAPGFVGARRAHRADQRHLPDDTYVSGTIRPGDLASSPSGQAALLIRRELERRDPSESTDSAAQVRKTWNRDVAVIVGVLTAWTAVALLV